LGSGFQRSKEAVLFLKKKNQKNFCPFGPRRWQRPCQCFSAPPLKILAALSHPTAGGRGQQARKLFEKRHGEAGGAAAKTPSGLKLPDLAPAGGKSFFASFLQKKKTLAFLPLV
jgi:hypothetical protein